MSVRETFSSGPLMNDVLRYPLPGLTQSAGTVTRRKRAADKRSAPRRTQIPVLCSKRHRFRDAPPRRSDTEPRREADV